ncbi:hypothetical protein GCM10010238_41280 [Streptomyces griseoviridis]|uniref:Uncharacterized protein n=1 Tax=Streptomyces griseoviridis TaxID=45398 RepID=A0A918GLY9_STRGD|nr:hypothetical protein GCM10010238_41280 [Streptomyces niveoruber]
MVRVVRAARGAYDRESSAVPAAASGGRASEAAQPGAGRVRVPGRVFRCRRPPVAWSLPPGSACQASRDGPGPGGLLPAGPGTWAAARRAAPAVMARTER